MTSVDQVPRQKPEGRQAALSTGEDCACWIATLSLGAREQHGKPPVLSEQCAHPRYEALGNGRGHVGPQGVELVPGVAQLGDVGDLLCPRHRRGYVAVCGSSLALFVVDYCLLYFVVCCFKSE